LTRYAQQHSFQLEDPMLDLMITNARIVDGLGTPAAHRND
jgi:hypothetical protein